MLTTAVCWPYVLVEILARSDSVPQQPEALGAGNAELYYIDERLSLLLRTTTDE